MSEKAQLQKTIDEPKSSSIPNRSDHIDYTEHMIRRIVQKSPLRSNFSGLPLKVKQEFQAHRNNLALYLNKRTAELKRQFPEQGKGPRPIRNLYLSENEDNSNRIFPNVPTSSAHNRTKTAERFVSPIKSIDTSKKANSPSRSQSPGTLILSRSYNGLSNILKPKIKQKETKITCDEKVKRIIISQLGEEKVDEYFQKYNHDQAINKAKKLKLNGLQHLFKGRVVSVTDRASYQTPKSRRSNFFFQTQLQEAPAQTNLQQKSSFFPSEAKKPVILDEKDLIENICVNSDLKVSNFFDLKEDEFNMRFLTPQTSRGHRVRTPTENNSENKSKSPIFDHTELRESLRSSRSSIRRMHIPDQNIAREREKNILFDKFTMNKGETLNKRMTLHSKSKDNIIKQTSIFEILRNG